MEKINFETKKIKELAKRCLEKWTHDDSLLSDPCGFCLHSGYNHAECVCPQILCMDCYHNDQSLFGVIVKTSFGAFVVDTDEDYRELMIKAMKDLSNNGAISEDLGKEISDIINDVIA